MGTSEVYDMETTTFLGTGNDPAISDSNVSINNAL